ncbi:MAG: sodium:solute symporter family protein [Phreatobacter sp.]|uniref:sodium:solute symporter family protein n=1 Tax=Phreatobacter sp. TaxID=1966341 RepID=UPI002737493B|nr:sodium:solute symporter family protein [Phreatobacter sp.]MDP2800543.1 sodium:solute symporter family protein [Phreatobacter sp.]
MTTQATGGGDFVSNLGRIYKIYTLSFLGFVVVLGVLEQLGLPPAWIGYAFVALTIGVYAAIGIITRTAEVSEYYVAGRKVPAMYNGMATAADWMSAASFIGMAGSLYLLGYNGLAFILGWTGGFVLVATLIAPFLRKFGAYTIPDFFAFRYGGKFARGLAIMVLMSCSFTYVVAQIVGTGLIGARLLNMDYVVAVYVGLVGILACSMLGGMRAVTWTQVAQYIVLIIAYLIPVVILSAQKYGIPIPQLTYGDVLSQIAAKEALLRAAGDVVVPAVGYINPTFGNPALSGAALWVEYVNYFGLILCLMVGTASLPHVLMRFFTTPSVREARKSVGWSLLFIFILYFTAPAYAAFAKMEVYNNVVGQNLTALFTADNLSWIRSYGRVGLIQICGVDATTLEAVRTACARVMQHTGDVASFNPVIQLRHFGIQADAIVISTPEIAGLPYVIAGLVAAGGLAAALSTADGLLLAMANALSHDVYYKMIDQNASTEKRLVVARVLLIVVAIAAAYVASFRPADIVAMVAWAFSLAAAGFFPALILGVWWKKATTQGAIWGLLAGFGITLYYLAATRYFAPAFYETWKGLSIATTAQLQAYEAAKAAYAAAATPANWAVLDRTAQVVANWWGVRGISSGVFGLPLGFLVIIVVSKFTKEPSQEMQNFIDEIRRPRGGVVMQEKESGAISH